MDDDALLANPATDRDPCLLARDVMKAPRTCSPFSTITEASLIFKDEDCGMVPVVEEGKPVGVVTDRDIALALGNAPDLATRPVSEVMTTDPVTVGPETPLVEAAQVMARAQVRRLLVVDAEGLLVGVIAWADMAPYLPTPATGDMVAEVVEEP
jgi:CBS domain-containing protein